MNAPAERRNRSIALFAALLFHIPLLLLLLSLKHDPVDTIWHLVLDEETLQRMREEEREQWVATRVPGGAPILLQSPSAQPSPSAKPEEAIGEDGPVQEREKPMEIAQSEPVEEQIEKEEVPKPQRVVEVQQAEEAKPAPTALAQEIPKPVIVAKPEEARPKPKAETGEDGPKKVVKKEQPKKEEPRTTVAPPAQSSVTLAQLAQGFVQHLKDAQEGEMNMEGAATGHPSEDQLRRGRYAQKILQCVIESYHRNRYRAPRVDHQTEICVAVVVNRDGTLGMFQLVQPSGVFEVDQFVQALFKDAGTSFPPMPSAFKQSVFPVRFNIPSVHAFS